MNPPIVIGVISLVFTLGCAAAPPSISCDLRVTQAVADLEASDAQGAEEITDSDDLQSLAIRRNARLTRVKDAHTQMSPTCATRIDNAADAWWQATRARFEQDARKRLAATEKLRDRELRAHDDGPVLSPLETDPKCAILSAQLKKLTVQSDVENKCKGVPGPCAKGTASFQIDFELAEVKKEHRARHCPIDGPTCDEIRAETRELNARLVAEGNAMKSRCVSLNPAFTIRQRDIRFPVPQEWKCTTAKGEVTVVRGKLITPEMTAIQQRQSELENLSVERECTLEQAPDHRCEDDRARLAQMRADTKAIAAAREEYLRTHCKCAFLTDVYPQARKAVVRNGEYVGPTGKVLLCDGKIRGNVPAYLSHNNWFSSDIFGSLEEDALLTRISSLSARLQRDCQKE